MTTILDALQKGTGYFEKHEVEAARLNMQHLLAHVRKCDRMELYTGFDEQLFEEELEQLRELMRRRVAGEPLQHLLGTVEFVDHEFLCDSRALIPRPETEHLVGVLAEMAWPDPLRILDVGTGSGVIGLSLAAWLKDERAEISATLSDVSSAALELAQENAKRIDGALSGCELQFVESDLLANIDGQFDLITANLPYISDADMTQLSKEVKHDPELALRGGARGTEIIERFLADLHDHLADDGVAAMEFGLGQEQLLEAKAHELGFGEVEIVKDDTDRDRFLLVRNSAD